MFWILCWLYYKTWLVRLARQNNGALQRLRLSTRLKIGDRTCYIHCPLIKTSHHSSLPEHGGRKRPKILHSADSPTTTNRYPKAAASLACRKLTCSSLCWARLQTTALLFLGTQSLKILRQLIKFGRQFDSIMVFKPLAPTSSILTPYDTTRASALRTSSSV